MSKNATASIQSAIKLWEDGHITFQTVLDVVKKELLIYPAPVRQIEEKLNDDIKCAEERAAEAIEKLLKEI